ncbi:HEPN domain-containing protein [Flavobacterium anhuiense]|uniref:HEPN domain-containing protein n=1 Tax=Flavobacterium anhuiense TaxID=459526 RepID=UPI003D964AFD
MNNSIILFNKSIAETKDLKITLDSIKTVVTAAINLEDFYRLLIVQTVSALDYFIHEFVLEEMIEIYERRRPVSNNFSNFTIPISSTLQSRPSLNILQAHIRQKHSWLSFQEPDKISDALKLISNKKIWEELSPVFSLNSGDLKRKLKLVIDRRNKIAHELDMNPSDPGEKWPINTTDVNDIIKFIEKLGNEIYNNIK